jgi:hypothetical protein
MARPGQRHVGAGAIAVASAVALAVVAPATPARADEPAPAPAPARDPYDAFPLTVPHDKHYVRAGLEIGGVLAVGLVDYMLSTTARGGTTRPGDTRWGLRYDWPVLRGKLIGTGLDLDTNKIATNYVSHPLAGTLYYTSARSNHLSLAESFALAIVGSTTWEFFGEIRETTSINDLIVTPVSGVAIGEPLMQLSGFFRRGKRRFGTDALAFLLSPVKFVNELTDDAEPLAATRIDALGLPADPYHRFVLTAGMGATVQEAEDAAHPRATYLDERFAMDLRLVNLPSYAGAGHESRLFDEGNVSRVRLDLGFSRGDLIDSVFQTSLVPFGYYTRDAAIDPYGRLRGYGMFVGVRMGFEYGGHDYDRDRAHASDIVTIASPIGVAAEYLWTSGGLEIRTALDLSGGISSVTPYAYSGYARRRSGPAGTDDVLTPVREQGYYHAFAITAAPTLEVAFRGVRSTTSLRFDSFREIEGHDENEELVKNGPRFSDRRSLLRTTLAYVPPATPWRVAIDLQVATRAGAVGEVEEARRESSAWASVGVEF